MRSPCNWFQTSRMPDEGRLPERPATLKATSLAYIGVARPQKYELIRSLILPSEECTSTHYEKSESFTKSCWNANRRVVSVQPRPDESGVLCPNVFRSHRPSLIAMSLEALTRRASSS